MSVLIGIALKSLLVAGLTLGLLHLLRKRSAAERSWVAHIGQIGLVFMVFARLALPSCMLEALGLFLLLVADDRHAVTGVDPAFRLR